MSVWTEMPTLGLFPWGKTSTPAIPSDGFGINGPLRKFGVPVTLGTSSDLTLTIAQLLAGYILRDPGADNRNDVFPTATLIVNGMGPGVVVGSYFDFWIKNTSATGSRDIVPVVGAGITLDPAAAEIAPLETALYRAMVTNIITPTVTIYCLGILAVPTGS